MKHYRYWNDNSGTIYLEKFDVISETEKCYWVISECFTNFSNDFKKQHRKRVSKTSRIRHCYPTHDEAWQSFISRKHHHINHLNRTLRAATFALNRANALTKPPLETLRGGICHGDHTLFD